MFASQSNSALKNYQLAVVGLSLLSATALVITSWMLIDFIKEQTIVDGLLKQLPRNAKGPAETLQGELKWQFRLTILLVINVVVTGIAVILLWRAYHASQTSLRDFKALASDVLSCMDQGVITLDLQGVITSINRRGLELLETDLSCVDHSIDELKNIPLHQYRIDWLAEQSNSMIRDYTVGSGGTHRKLRAFCQFLKDRNGKIIGNVLQLRDVTERVFVEERMRRMERYMGLGTLAAGLHHEIKNPLAALSLHVQLLEEQLEADNASEENLQTLSVIRTGLSRIGGVLEGFRDFASIDSLNIGRVDANAMLEQQVELMRPQALGQDIQIAFHPCDPPAFIAADQTRLEQASLNLIVNAIEAMPDGGLLTISTRRSNESLRISVSDTGRGIPPDLVDRILDPYFTTKSHGTGLGLAICDKIIRQHLGSLEIDTSSRGTTFIAVLPIDPPATFVRQMRSVARQ